MSVSALKLPPNPPVTEHTCFHCHDTCPDERLQIEDKFFCCDGCKMVYEILNTNNLCQYYSLDEKAGIGMKNRRDARAYAYLDDPDVQEKLLEFNDGKTAQVTFYLPNMHCVSCLWLLEHLYKLDEGVFNTRVNFLKKTAMIQFDPAGTSLRKIAALLSSIGYAPDINLADVDNAKAPAMNKRLAYQIAIAGFAVGNVMLFSFPEYLGMSRTEDPWFAKVFGYLSLFLATPVLIFSAQDYLISAWNGLRNRYLNVDIPLVLAILSLYFRSLWDILTQTGAGYLDSFSGLIFLLLVGKWFQQKTWNQLSFERDYKSYFPVAATLKENDAERSTPVNRLVPGDIIIVRSQEIIPADGVLLKGAARLDYSFVTGESEPVAVQAGDRIFAGGKQIGESIEISLTKRVAQSYLTRLWNDQAFKTQEKGKISRLADQAGRVFSILILAFGFGGFIYWAPTSMSTAINAFSAVMIVACPCTIIFSMSFALGNVLRIFGQNRFYLKNIQVIESLAASTAVVFDKTGTITDVAQQQYKFLGEPLTYTEKIAVRSLTRHSSHPLSRRLYESLEEIPVVAPDQYEEMPGLGIQGVINGKQVKVGSAELVGAETGSGVYVAIDGHLKGHFEVRSHYRQGLQQVLQFFRKKRSTWLISGDRDQEAARLQPLFPQADSMFFNRSPQEKLDFVKNLQRHGQSVLMLGDGLNDAGALQQSNAGIVVAENTNNFTPACDGILHADEFARLPQMVKMAESGVRIIKQSYIIALTYNLVGLSFAVTGSLSPLSAAVLMPVSSVSIVLFGILAGNLKAKRLGLN
ncbi:MAG: heavy metal translocating P-type ATPase metal-binding domain-containing protein [Bacteroidota bacterium]